MDALIFMLPPFAACLTLIGIHGYFGIHVLKRQIIFIDIAMAQITAFGVTLGLIFHIEPETPLAYLFPLAFVIIAAFIFSSLKYARLRIPLEAIIGMSYALATAAAVLVLDLGAGSHEHTKEMLIGSILWVSWPQILKSLFIYSGIGIVHYAFRDKILAISENYEHAKMSGINVRLWDFIFYLTLGITVVCSVQIGGILVVFAFLVIPASISTLFSQKWLSRILIGWTIGTLVSIFGLFISWKYDAPSGPAVILFLAIFLLVAFSISKIVKKKNA